MDTRPFTLPTFTGKLFHPIDTDPSTICIEDIAHGLSQLCRFSGQCPRFYSVAEHSYLMATSIMSNQKEIVDSTVARSALLHDASEAYIVDVPNYIKHLLPNYKWIEERLQGLIDNKFGTYSNLEIIKTLDKAILKTEIMDMFKFREEDFKQDRLFLHNIQPLPVALANWEPQKAEKKFLDLYERLS